MNKLASLASPFAIGLAIAIVCVACGDDSTGGGGGAGGEAPATLEVPPSARLGDELVLTVRASTVGGDWADSVEPGAVITVNAGANLSRNVILVGGFAQETKASLGPWDGTPVTWTIEGEATLETMALSIDPTAAGIPILALASDEYANDTPLAMFQDGADLNYVMTNEDGGTGLFPTLLLAQWGRPHDIEALYNLESQAYQGPNHETLPFAGTFEGTHPRLRMATSNGLVAPEDAASRTARYHVSPMPVAFSPDDGVPRERVLDDFPWLVAAGWQEVAREGKVDADGGLSDPMLGELSAYVFVDYQLDGGVLASFEVLIDGTWVSSLGIYADSTGLLDARCSGTRRTAIELPGGVTIDDVAGVRVVTHEGSGALLRARVLAYDPVLYTPLVFDELARPVSLDASTGPVEIF